MMEISTILRWASYSKGARGHGFVGFNLTEAEKKKGCYDPHTMFIHKKLLDEKGEWRNRYVRNAGGWSDFANEALEAEIESDCAELARLLAKFMIGHDYFADPDIAGRIADGQTERLLEVKS
jgi:hypothetical protein